MKNTKKTSFYVLKVLTSKTQKNFFLSFRPLFFVFLYCASVMNLCGRVHEEVVVVDEESVSGVSEYEYVGWLVWTVVVTFSVWVVMISMVWRAMSKLISKFKKVKKKTKKSYNSPKPVISAFFFTKFEPETVCKTVCGRSQLCMLGCDVFRGVPGF